MHPNIAKQKEMKLRNANNMSMGLGPQQIPTGRQDTSMTNLTG